jgi:TRAP-type mannitol/chloroaromatic compound transport system permease small subunit
MTRILHAVDLLNEWLGKIFSGLIIALMAVILYDTFMRYVMNAPTLWGMDVNKMLLLGIVCLGGGYCLLHGGHVKVDILWLVFPPRVRALLDLFTHLFVLMFCAVLVIYGGHTAWDSYIVGERSSESAWDFVLWPVLSLVPLAGILLGLQALTKWLRDLVMVVTGENRMASKVVRGGGGLRG